jgi:excisionase family DNA binding protein
MEDLLTAEEAAKILRISTKTLKDWCRARKLPCIKVGRAWRLRRVDLEAFTTPDIRVVRGGEEESPQ